MMASYLKILSVAVLGVPSDGASLILSGVWKGYNRVTEQGLNSRYPLPKSWYLSLSYFVVFKISIFISLYIINSVFSLTYKVSVSPGYLCTSVLAFLIPIFFVLLMYIPSNPPAPTSFLNNHYYAQLVKHFLTWEI